MKITRLHLILLAAALGLTIVYFNQVQREKKQHIKEIAAVETAQESERLKNEAREMERVKRLEEINRVEELEKEKEQAIKIVAVAGEYWLKYKKSGRDVQSGQATLRQAKENLANENFYEAIELAVQAIEELKNAPIKEVFYEVVKGDNLWAIALMSKHYGRGSKWTIIWRANEEKIPDFDLIYPKQVLLIPRER